MKIVIDTGHIAHRVRKFIYRLRGKPHHASRCIGCGAGLNATERQFYENHCERCAPDFMWNGQ